MATIKIPQVFAAEMIEHSLNDFPDEACGIIAGKGGTAKHLYRMTNVEKSPYRYNMDPKELYLTYTDIDDHGWDVYAIYHSHTHSEAYPSSTDVRLATWPEAFYILVSLQVKDDPVIRGFNILDTAIKEAAIIIE